MFLSFVQFKERPGQGWGWGGVGFVVGAKDLWYLRDCKYNSLGGFFEDIKFRGFRDTGQLMHSGSYE